MQRKEVRCRKKQSKGYNYLRLRFFSSSFNLKRTASQKRNSAGLSEGKHEDIVLKDTLFKRRRWIVFSPVVQKLSFVLVGSVFMRFGAAGSHLTVEAVGE